MGYIKEPKGVNFVVEPHVVTAEDRRIISESIAHYKATGKFKKLSSLSGLVVPKRRPGNKP
jgi:hypothetical protein